MLRSTLKTPIHKCTSDYFTSLNNTWHLCGQVQYATLQDLALGLPVLSPLLSPPCLKLCSSVTHALITCIRSFCTHCSLPFSWVSFLPDFFLHPFFIPFFLGLLRTPLVLTLAVSHPRKPLTLRQTKTAGHPIHLSCVLVSRTACVLSLLNEWVCGMGNGVRMIPRILTS